MGPPLAPRLPAVDRSRKSGKMMKLGQRAECTLPLAPRKHAAVALRKSGRLGKLGQTAECLEGKMGGCTREHTLGWLSLPRLQPLGLRMMMEQASPVSLAVFANTKKLEVGARGP